MINPYDKFHVSYTVIVPYLHDHPLFVPTYSSLVRDTLSGNGCGSPNHM